MPNCNKKLREQAGMNRKEIDMINQLQWKWTREPKAFTITDNKIEIITNPHTDLWQRTYYHFRNDNASFKATFTDMEITECKWLAHDGQAPDELE